MSYAVYYCTRSSCHVEKTETWESAQEIVVDKYGKEEYTGLYVEQDGIVIWEESDV